MKRMSKKIIIPHRIICADAENRILKNSALELTDNKISSFIPVKEIKKKEYDEVFDYSSYTLIPGFIQTHVHLCQTLFRGLAEEMPLMDWLQKKIFPFENAHNKNSLRASAKIGISELLLSGTTTILDMGTLRHQEIVFDEMIKSGIRGFSGKCMIDENDLYPHFKSSTKAELKDALNLAQEFHNSQYGRIKYGFAPRFVLSCSEELLKETKEMTKNFPGSIYHTHSSENKNEISEVKRRFNKESIEYLNFLNLVDNHTVLAHCVHTNQNERRILKEKEIKVAHCPSSNLKLGSGIAPIPEYLKAGISVTLGADGAPCNNNLSIFNEMKLASLIQKPAYGTDAMDALTVFRMATIEGAKALHIENETGSIEIGKNADLVLIELNNSNDSLLDSDDNVYTDIVYSSSAENINCVMVNGRWLVKDKQSQVYDQHEITNKGREELKELMIRVK